MKYSLDCEFIEDGKTIDLITIGIVSEDGRELHFGNNECKFERASDWVKANVLHPMGFVFGSDGSLHKYPDNWSSGFWATKAQIASYVAEFMGAEYMPGNGTDPDGYALKADSPKPEIWGEWASYDWVVFCQLFGTMMDLPKGFPMRCRDVVQYCEDNLGLSTNDWPESLEVEGNHDALLGAKTVKARYQWCVSQAEDKKFREPWW